MKKLTKTGLALFLVLSMLTTLFAGVSVTARTASTTATEVYYCGAKLDATNKYLHTQLVGGNNVTMASANASESGYTLHAQFDATTGTLTYKAGFASLEEWNTMSNMVQLEGGGVYYGIKADGDLIIELGDYNNFLYLPNNQPTDNALSGVDVAGDLTINGGTGMLKITAQPSLKAGGGLRSYGIRADGDINLNGGTVYIFGTATASGVNDNYTTFIDATGHNINANGATVKLRGKAHSTVTGVTKYSGTLVKSDGYTESADNKIDISDSRGIESVVAADWWSTNNNLTLTPPEPVDEWTVEGTSTKVFYCGALLDAEKPYLHRKLVSGNNETLASANETETGYTLLAEFDASTGTLTYKSGFADLEAWETMSNMVQFEDGGMYYGIRGNGDLTIDLGSYNNFLYMPNNQPTDNAICGVEAAGSLTINGKSGMLKITAQPSLKANGGLRSYGLRAVDGDIMLNGGTVFVYGAASATGVNDNYTTFIDAGENNIILNGAMVKLRGKYHETVIGVTKYTGTLVKNKEYIESEDKKIDIGNGLGREDTITADWWNTNNNLTLTPILHATKVYYCGALLDSTNKYLHRKLASGNNETLASANETETGYTLLAEFDASTGTLTYKSGFASVEEWETMSNMVQLEVGGIYYGIKANGDLTIELGEYKNFLYYPNNGPSDNAVHAIDVDGKLTINGTTGTLKMSANLSTKAGGGLNSRGIYAKGDVTLNGGTVYIYQHGTTSGVNDNYTTLIDAEGYNIYANGATVKLRGTTQLSVNGITKYKGTLVKAEGYTESADNKIQLSNGIAEAENAATTDWWTNNNNLTLTPPAPPEEPIPDGPAQEIEFCGAVLNAEKPYLLAPSPFPDNGYVKASAQTSEANYTLLATFEAGRLTFNSGYSEGLAWNSMINMAEDEEDGVYRGIKASGDLVIDVGPYHNTLFLGWTEPKGMALHAIEVNGDLTVIGTTGTLKMCATPAMETAAGASFMSYGIKVAGDLRLNGGNVYIYEASYSTVKEGNGSTFISAGGNIYVDGAKVKMRARKATPGIVHFNKEPIVSAGYVETADTNVDIARSGFASLGEEVAAADNNNNLTLTPPARQRVVVGGAELSKDKPYLVRINEVWSATHNAEGAYAVYNGVNNTLTFNKDTVITAMTDALTEEDGSQTTYANTCILADSDVEIIIPANVTVTLNADSKIGISRALWAASNIKISGNGTLDAYAGPSQSGNYLSAAIWAEGKVTISGSNAVLRTVKAEAGGKSGHVVYGNAGIEFADGATVCAGTDLGKLFNTAPVIYNAATAMMATESTGNYNAPVAESDLLLYDATRITDMKYLQVIPMAMALENAAGYGENGNIALSDPVIEYTFNYDIASGAALENVTVAGGATVESVTADGNVLKVKLGNVLEDGRYTVSVSNIANILGSQYSGTSTFDVSDVDVNVTKVGNTVSVTINAESSQKVFVIATVWSEGIYGRKLKQTKSAPPTIVNGSDTITVDGLTLAAGDIVKVLIWDGAETRNVLRKSVEFSN